MALTAPTPQDWRTQQAIVLQQADAAVIRLLKRAQRDINAQLREIRSRPAGIGRDVREAQLQLVRRNLSEQLGKTWRELGNLVEARRAEAVARAINYQKQLDTFKLLGANVPGGSDIAENIARAEAFQSSQGIDRMMARTTGASYVPLSRRVYNSNVGINSQVDRMINSALARGLSVDEFARELQPFIDPNTPGGIRYAALRLARSEINNAAHAQAVSSVQGQPWIKKMKWNRSKSHPRRDICDTIAEGGPYGDGTYDKTAVPVKPHPQCFCFPTAVDEESDDDFLDSLVGGEFDDYLDANSPQEDGSPPNPVSTPVAPPPAPTPVTPTQPPRPGASRPTPTILTDEERARRKREQIDEAKAMIAAGKTLPEVTAELKRKHKLPNSQALLIWQQANREHKEEQARNALSARPARVTTSTAPTPWPEQDDRSIAAIVTLPPSGARDEVMRELRRQNALVPNTLAELVSVGMATHADRVRVRSMDSLAWYQPWDRRIFLGNDIFSDRYENQVWTMERNTNWCSRTGHSHSGGQAVLAHEFGHHVHNMLDRMPYGDRRKFYHAVANALGIQPPVAISDANLEEWMTLNKYAIINQVSKYGATSIQEMMAEVWQEYSTSGDGSRPAILAIGKLMQDLAERGAGR